MTRLSAPLLALLLLASPRPASAAEPLEPDLLTIDHQRARQRERLAFVGAMTLAGCSPTVPALLTATPGATVYGQLCLYMSAGFFGAAISAALADLPPVGLPNARPGVARPEDWGPPPSQRERLLRVHRARRTALCVGAVGLGLGAAVPAVLSTIVLSNAPAVPIYAAASMLMGGCIAVDDTVRILEGRAIQTSFLPTPTGFLLRF